MFGKKRIDFKQRFKGKKFFIDKTGKIGDVVSLPDIKQNQNRASSETRVRSRSDRQSGSSSLRVTRQRNAPI